MQRDTFIVEKFPSLERFQSDFRERTIDVCIATEEIIGPVRNGGIASTYYHLARGLARQGHRVTVLYLKGRRVENETPEHWIEHYKEFGIDLVYLDVLEEPVLAAAERWQARYYAFYRWLKENDRFQVVHTSEWRGGAFYCLQAKRLGLAFADTFFIVKTSSPHIWNRHYQMQPIDEPDLMTAAFAEQKCVEWADMVVGGSAHLLSFMRHIGYTIPDGRTYAQPNIIDFSEVIVTDLRDERPFGDIMRTKDMVFFGRLEPRKGLELFCDAMNALVSRGIAPERLTFLGKEGERLSNRGGAKPLDFIEANARHWPFPVEIVTDRNQPEALSYMCSREMIAVMPSLIENSTMAVYEALVHKIPFIATAVGGTPELVSEAYHQACLIEPSAEALAAQMERALTEGQPIATPAFDNDHNLETWYAFHRYVAEHGVRALIDAHAVAEEISRPRGERVAYLAYPASHQAAHALLARLADESTAFEEVILLISFLLSPEERQGLEAIAPANVRLADAIGVSIGDAFNRAAATIASDILIFDGTGAVRLRPGFVPAIRTALTAQPHGVCSSFVEFPEDPNSPDPDSSAHILFMPMGGDIASQYTTNAAYGVEVIAMRAETLEAVGPFEPYNLNAGILHEFVSRAIPAGHEFFTVPEPLIDYAGREHPLNGLSSNYQYLKSKPLIDSVPIHLKKILLYFLGRRPGGRAAQRGANFMWKANRDEGQTAWLTNVSKLGDAAIDEIKRGPILIGFDHRRSRLKVALWGVGDFRVSVNNELDLEERDYGRPGALSIRFIDVLPLFENGEQRVWVKIEFNDEKNKRQRVLAVQQLDDHLFFLGSKRPVFWDGAFEQATQVLMALGGKAKPAASVSVAAE